MAEHIGTRIRRARMRCGMRAVDLARKMGIPRQNLYAVESGQTANPSAQFIERVAEALNCSADYLLGGKLIPRRSFAELEEVA
jgi:transcriptional regulator with XRE-family HTH domain